jgi:probable phosphomutase (TIGR03848 family)
LVHNRIVHEGNGGEWIQSGASACRYSSPVAVLLLIRHAVTEATGKVLIGNAPGYHLSDEGRAQAAALARRLSAVPLAAVYTSPLERCLETAAAIAAGRRLTVRSLDDLEEVGFGQWTGRPLSQLARTKMWRQVHAAPSTVRFPAGETFSETQHRAVAALDGMAARHPRAAIGVVSHGDVIRLAVAHYAGLHMDLLQRVVVAPASVSVIALGKGGPALVKLNDTGTLDDLAPRRRRPTKSRGSDRDRPARSRGS